MTQWLIAERAGVEPRSNTAVERPLRQEWRTLKEVKCSCLFGEGDDLCMCAECTIHFTARRANVGSITLLRAMNLSPRVPAESAQNRRGAELTPRFPPAEDTAKQHKEIVYGRAGYCCEFQQLQSSICAVPSAHPLQGCLTSGL
ncbi:hypothetical protein AAFF_G00093100 [Aldrovandia affinis]|uniref:Uncharacterized protein n=1 Tax=Aldrovandia affinis TaxID=143900 RepID=A0AAD7T2M9_9TELE|nr:hypothetical protein AAFF_G00093100 [Aldrovandia affinis]